MFRREETRPKAGSASAQSAEGTGLGRLSVPPFTVDLESQELRLDEAAIDLRPRTFAVLAYLVQNSGRLVTKRELIDEVWRGVVVTEHLVAVCVSELRRALGDTAQNSRFIQTMHRRGYRFVGDVARIPREPDPVAGECTALLDLAEAAWRRGAVAEARDAAGRAAAIARRTGSPEELARAALALGGPNPRPSRFNELGAALAEALAALPAGDSSLKARVLAQLAVASYLVQGHEARNELCSRAVTMARRVGDPQTLLTVLESCHRALWEPDYLAWRLGVADELVETGHTNDDYPRELGGLSLRAMDRFESADLSGADADIERYRTLAEANGDVVHTAVASWFEALSAAAQALLQGRLSEVQRLTERALAFGERVQPDVARQHAGIQLFILHREQGDLETLHAGLMARAQGDQRGPGWRSGLAAICLPDFRQKYGEFWNDPGWHVGAALVYADLGRLDQAREHLRTLARDGFADLLGNPSWMAAATLLAEVCVELDDRPSATILLNALSPWAEHHVVLGPASCLAGSVARPLALLSHVLERWDAADAHFRDATVVHARLDAQPLLARTRYEHARMLLARRRPTDRKRGLRLATLSVEAAQRMGMRVLAATADRAREDLE